MYLISFLILLSFVGVTLILPLAYYLVKKKKVLLKIFFGVWGFVAILFCVLFVIGFINSKTEVNKKDIYGTYIIDRDFFKGNNADWQYNHYRFEITKNDELYFYMTDGQKVLKIYKREVKFIEGYASTHLKIINENPKFILESEPTLYRNSWDFYFVFKTKPYANMFFKKGKWKPINN